MLIGSSWPGDDGDPPSGAAYLTTPENPVRRHRENQIRVHLLIEKQDHEVLAELANLDRLSTKRPAQAITRRFSGGCSIPDVAELFNVSTRIIDAKSHFERAWLKRFMERSDKS